MSKQKIILWDEIDKYLSIINYLNQVNEAVLKQI